MIRTYHNAMCEYGVLEETEMQVLDIAEMNISSRLIVLLHFRAWCFVHY